MTAERIDGSAGTAVHGARPDWLAEPCPEWCDKLHDEQAFEADRRHLASGYLAQVVLSTEDPVVLPVEARQVGEALMRLAGLAGEDGRGGSDPAPGRG